MFSVETEKKKECNLLNYYCEIDNLTITLGEILYDICTQLYNNHNITHRSVRIRYDKKDPTSKQQSKSLSLSRNFERLLDPEYFHRSYDDNTIIKQLCISGIFSVKISQVHEGSVFTILFTLTDRDSIYEEYKPEKGEEILNLFLGGFKHGTTKEG